MARGKEALTELGIKVEVARIKKGLTLTQLAEAIGTSPSFLGHITHGRRPGRAYISKIAKILEIDLSKFEENDAAS